LALHQEACAAGDAERCYAGYAEVRRAHPARAGPLLAEAVKAFDRACGGGSAAACLRLGGIHRWVTRDSPGARRTWARACAVQEIQGCVEEARLGGDLPSALQRLVEACSAGYRSACGAAEDHLLRGR
jgi:TPR repeat protein